jgi:hypothetical protein
MPHRAPKGFFISIFFQTMQQRVRECEALFLTVHSVTAYYIFAPIDDMLSRTILAWEAFLKMHFDRELTNFPNVDAWKGIQCAYYGSAEV